MNETQFTRKVLVSWQALNEDSVFFHKIADMPSGFGHTVKVVDVLGCTFGVPFSMEWKLIKSGKSIPTSVVKPHQIEVCTIVESAGGLGFIMVGVYKSRKEQCVYSVPVEKWRKFEKRAKEKDRKSIPLKWLTKYENKAGITGTGKQGWSLKALMIEIMKKPAYFHYINRKVKGHD